MQSIRPTTAATLLSLLALGACSSTGSGPTSGPDAQAAASAFLHCDFDRSSSALPAGWQIATSNPRPDSQDARWEQVADSSAPSAPNAFALVDARGHRGQAFNLAWSPEVSLVDLDVTVRVRADGGVEDQGGGPAWRIAGANDYYVARWNPLEDNFRVYSVVGGERLQLDSARVRADPDAWHTIRVRQVGSSITCWFNGKELLHTTDTKLPAAGAVGVWTKADATTRFDDLRVDEAR